MCCKSENRRGKSSKKAFSHRNSYIYIPFSCAFSYDFVRWPFAKVNSLALLKKTSLDDLDGKSKIRRLKHETNGKYSTVFVSGRVWVFSFRNQITDFRKEGGIKN
jgi:hypothetical protein